MRRNQRTRPKKVDPTIALLTKDAAEDPRLKMKRRGGPPNKRRRVRGGGPTTTRNAASGVIEIPDDDLTDINSMYLSRNIYD